MLAVPVISKLPLARGVPAVGRRRTFCQVSLQGSPLTLELVTVKVSLFVVTLVMARTVPSATLLILLAAPPPPLIRFMSTVGAPPVSNTNPLGALSTIVPVLTLPPVGSE